VKNAGGTPAAATSADVGQLSGGLYGWRCGNNSDGTTVLAKYLPAPARG